MGDFEDEDSAVQDFLNVLEEHRKNCEAEGKYVEAEIARNRLEELRLHEENRRREAMRSRQIAERLGVRSFDTMESFSRVVSRLLSVGRFAPIVPYSAHFRLRQRCNDAVANIAK